MKTDWNTREKAKLRIAKNVLLYIQGDKELKTAILSDLKDFSRVYHIKIARVSKSEDIGALIEFLDEDSGYEKSISKLYWSL